MEPEREETISKSRGPTPLRASGPTGRQHRWCQALRRADRHPLDFAVRTEAESAPGATPALSAHISGGAPEGLRPAPLPALLSTQFPHWCCSPAPACARLPRRRSSAPSSLAGALRLRPARSPALLSTQLPHWCSSTAPGSLAGARSRHSILSAQPPRCRSRSAPGLPAGALGRSVRLSGVGPTTRH